VLVDREAEQQVAILQSAVGAIRTIKATYNLKVNRGEAAAGEGEAEGEAAQKKLQFTFKSSDEKTRQVLQDQRELIELLTRAQLHSVVAEVESTKGTIAQVEAGLTALLLHADTLIDIPTETARLQKEAAKVQKELSGIKDRLAKPDFVARAKPEVVELNRARVLEMEQHLVELAQHEAALRSM
jgi:valyl-tRNA synthetase